jgi:hypothetical protein
MIKLEAVSIQVNMDKAKHAPPPKRSRQQLATKIQNSETAQIFEHLNCFKECQCIC